MSKRLIMWILLGLPIYAINYGLFLVVFGIIGSSTMAYWSWPLAAPITLRMWDYVEHKFGDNKV
jgi:hypothetical protein